MRQILEVLLLSVLVTGCATQLETVLPIEQGETLVPGTVYHEVGEIACALGAGQPDLQCRYGVTRTGAGSGVVTITKPDGKMRSVFFEAGQAVRYDTNLDDGGPFSAERADDVTIARIGAERYDIPDTVIFG